MKNILVLAIFFSFYNKIYSQNFTISALKQPQTVYLNLDNYLSCTVEGLRCNSIILSTNNGLIKKISPCKYLYRPLRTEDTKIIISKKINNNINRIGECFLPVRNIPVPHAAIGGLEGGFISKGALNAQAGIGAYPAPFLGFELNYLVKSFVVTATRSNNFLFFYYSNSQIFTSELHNKFDSLQKDDRVVFSSIIAELSDHGKINVKPIEFIIK
jgi:hypothetical protein